jgi:hypothetical protein
MVNGDRYGDRGSTGLGCRKEIIPTDCAGFVFVYKAHPPVHIRICVDGCNAVDGRKNKQGGGIISFLHP